MSRRAEPIQHFLLVFDHDAGHLIESIDFGSDGERAVEAYAAKERQYEAHSHPRIEIVLIGSDSMETVKLTHANYSDGSVAAVSKYLVGL